MPCSTLLIQEAVNQIQAEACSSISASKKVQLGQFFTPPSIADFMASMFCFPKKIKLLDAGAGGGNLTSAFIERAIAKGSKVHATAFELDKNIAHHLNKLLSLFQEFYPNQIEFTLKCVDFLLDRNDAETNCFSHAILNPPYKKISSKSAHRIALREEGIETVNLYSAFVARAIKLLRTGGELVAIIPRSFCNGLYYKPFRELILRECGIKRIHVFESRKKAFKHDDVLQENVIIHLVKGKSFDKIELSLSEDQSFSDLTTKQVCFHDVIKPGDPELYFHFPFNEPEGLFLPGCVYKLSDLGIEVSTGPLVDFRLKNLWDFEGSQESLPFVFVHHIQNGEFSWPKNSKKPSYIKIDPSIKKWLFPNGNYVLVKRFSSKEEKRRLAAFFFREEMLSYPEIGFENHLNVIHSGKKGIGKSLAAGLTTYLNSSFVDNYFRTFSGHTQVNATDLRNMKFPSKQALEDMGFLFLSLKKPCDILIDEIVKRVCE